MKGQLKAATPQEYLDQLEEPRKTEVAALDAVIRKAAPKLEAFVQMGILAYGRHRLKYESGREVDWFKIGVSSNASYISLYGLGPTETYKDSFPKAKLGKGCVRFKRLTDLDQKELTRLIKAAAKAVVTA